MINIGNDIISLKSVNKNRTKNERFYSKILTSKEVELYNPSKFDDLLFEDFVWLLFSVKEAVYKCLQKNDTGLVFSSKKIIVSHIDLPQKQSVSSFTGSQYESVDIEEKNCYKSTVHLDDIIFYGRSIIFKELIYTLVSNNSGFSAINWGIATIESCDYESQHAGVRTFVLDRLNANYPGNDFQIKKSSFGFPVITNDAVETPILISLSHHEQFVAYAFLDQKNNF